MVLIRQLTAQLVQHLGLPAHLLIALLPLLSHLLEIPFLHLQLGLSLLKQLILLLKLLNHLVQLPFLKLLLLQLV
jgi:hypothetical protein